MTGRSRSWSRPISSAAPSYHFNVTVNGRPDGPKAAVAFRDLAAARKDAIATCGEMLRDIDGDLPVNSEWQMHVKDLRGRLLFTLRFSESGHGA